MNRLTRVAIQAILLGMSVAGLVGGTAGGAQTATGPLTVYGARPEVGGTYRPRLQPETPASGGAAETQRHRDFAGKPCMTVSGSARAFATNAKLFDHLINAENNCPKAIRIQVCYLQSNDCVPIEIPGYGRKEVVLGTMPSQKDFRFQFQEKF